MSIPGELLDKTFWTLFAVESVAAAAMLVYVLGWGIRHAGPEGPVGAWLVFLPPLVLGVLWLVFTRAQSQGTKIAVVVFMALPVVQLSLGGAHSVWMSFLVNRQSQGDADFPRGPGRELAHAIASQDVARVKVLLDAGAMQASNTKPGGETFLRFAFVAAPQAGPEDPRSVAVVEIVRLLLRAGANPNEPAFGSNWPLTLACFRDPDAVTVLLEGGADPNLPDSAGRPLWWDALGFRNEGLRTLETLVQHGPTSPSGAPSMDSVVLAGPFTKGIGKAHCSCWSTERPTAGKFPCLGIRFPRWWTGRIDPRAAAYEIRRCTNWRSATAWPIELCPMSGQCRLPWLVFGARMRWPRCRNSDGRPLWWMPLARDQALNQLVGRYGVGG